MINTIYIISNLISTIAAESIKNKNISDAITVRLAKHLKTGFTGRKPKIELNGINVKGKFVKTGSVVIRPLEKEFITNLSGEFHYGVVLGTDTKKVEHILEMTTPSNLQIVNKKGFLSKYSQDKLSVHSTPKKTIKLDDIYKRAEKYEYSPYSLLNLNCKDVAFYCAHGIEPKRRSDELNKFALELNNLCSKLDELYLSNATEDYAKKFHKSNMLKLKEQQKIISENIEKK